MAAITHPPECFLIHGPIWVQHGALKQPAIRKHEVLLAFGACQARKHHLVRINVFSKAVCRLGHMRIWLRAGSPLELQRSSLASLRSLLPLNSVQLRRLAFLDRFVPLALNRTEAGKSLRTVVASQKMIPLGIVEPVHRLLVLCHLRPPGAPATVCRSRNITHAALQTGTRNIPRVRTLLRALIPCAVKTQRIAWSTRSRRIASHRAKAAPQSTLLGQARNAPPSSPLCRPRSNPATDKSSLLNRGP